MAEAPKPLGKTYALTDLPIAVELGSNQQAAITVKKSILECNPDSTWKLTVQEGYVASDSRDSSPTFGPYQLTAEKSASNRISLKVEASAMAPLSLAALTLAEHQIPQNARAHFVEGIIDQLCETLEGEGQDNGNNPVRESLLAHVISLTP